ncbi:hypothetical protein N7467_004881 [Penicillium canescens]|nr:hypothetical protein N7467_004881 [Penicillium canescens]
METFSLEAILSAFRYVQPGVHLGKIVVSIRDAAIQIILGADVQQRKKYTQLDGSGIYVLIGGLGGLGCSISTWMNTAVHPKVKGAWNLHNASVSANADLDIFILFSSLSGVYGYPGQTNYAAANSFLDAFSQYCSTLGFPACAIAIGSVEEVGYTAERNMKNVGLLRWNSFGPRPSSGDRGSRNLNVEQIAIYFFK